MPLTFTQTMLIIAGFFAILSVLIVLVFLRPSATLKAKGTIIEKTFVPASNYSQQPVGAQRGFRGTNTIPISESYTFKIKLDSGKIISNNINTISASKFDVGQTVDVTYTQKGIPLIWKKILVTEMK